MSVETQYFPSTNNEKRKRMSTGLQVNCPHSLRVALQSAYEFGYHFIVTQVVHPNYKRDLLHNKPMAIGRTDRILQGFEWSRFIVGKNGSIMRTCITQMLQLKCRQTLI